MRDKGPSLDDFLAHSKMLDNDSRKAEAEAEVEAEAVSRVCHSRMNGIATKRITTF